MISRLLTFFLIISVPIAGYTGVRALSRNPCTTTKTWSIGAIDPRFGISNETVQLYSEEAAEAWNTHYRSNELLAFKETGGDITITFVYDERQRTTIANERIKRTIEEERQELQDLKHTIDALRAEYASLEASIAAKTAAYNSRLAKHNKDVAYWNSRGGAPPDAFQRMQREAASLETDRSSLNASISRYNQLAETIRNRGKDHNEIVSVINEKISTLNETASREFEEGTYDPTTRTITIYEYASAAALKRVLIHEFGHALSLGHAETKEAIMYPVNQGKNLILAEEDIALLLDRCREKTLADVAQTAKLIRDDIFRLAGWSSYDTAAQAR